MDSRICCLRWLDLTLENNGHNFILNGLYNPENEFNNLTLYLWDVSVSVFLTVPDFFSGNCGSRNILDVTNGKNNNTVSYASYTE